MFENLWLSSVKESGIACMLNIKVKMVPVYAKVLGLPPQTKTSPPHKKLGDKDLELIREMWKGGAMVKEIAEYFSVHETTILIYLHAMGLKRKERRKMSGYK